MDRLHFAQVFIGVVVVIALLIWFSSPVWAYDPPEATRVLTQQGYKDVKIKGYAWFACAREDFWRTKFEATALDGSKVTGAVCGGFFKNNTVRLD